MRLLGPCAAALLVLCAASSASAQEPPPRIGRFVLDLHGSVPMFPSDDLQLAKSRGIKSVAPLPGSGLGIQAGAHIYILKIKVMTIGLGAEFAAGGASFTPPAATTTTTTTTTTTATLLPSVEERFSTVSPQLSLNFGHGRGWSYLSGGIGISNWALVPNGQEGFAADSEPLKTLNYGGGARWFVKPHVAFSFDVRIYVISPGSVYITGELGSPRTALMIIGAGISIK